jgi:hypothetical protein
VDATASRSSATPTVAVQIGGITLGVSGRVWRVLDDGGQPYVAEATRNRLNAEARLNPPSVSLLFDPEEPSPDFRLAQRVVAQLPNARILEESSERRRG